MSDSCCAPQGAASHNNGRWRRILWIALAINAVMFAVEIAASIRADSRALQADAIDFLGDAGNYAISLAVAPMALAWRARAAVLKAATMFAFGVGVLAVTFGACWRELRRAPRRWGRSGWSPCWRTPRWR